jgi:hypothetical protein
MINRDNTPSPGKPYRSRSTPENVEALTTAKEMIKSLQNRPGQCEALEFEEGA